MIQRLMLIAGWFAAMYGALQIQNIEMGHSFCGAWGCGPPANALIGMHLFWLTFLAPPIGFAAIKTNLAWSMIGKKVIGISVLGLIAIGIYDYFFSFNQGFYDAGYVWQRYLLSVGSLVDVPVVQTLLIGIGLARFGRGCSCCSGETATQSIEAPTDVGVDIVPVANE